MLSKAQWTEVPVTLMRRVPPQPSRGGVTRAPAARGLVLSRESLEAMAEMGFSEKDAGYE
jgi:hypothetical protein